MQHIPEEFYNHLKTIKEFDEEAFKKAHLNNPSKVSIRLNPFKLSDLFIEQEIVPWSKTGRYLNERPSFTFDPLFHAGCYYVQESSSMFIEEIFRQNVDLTKQINVLDLCAAPGGKSTLINSLISSESLLVSNEVVNSRIPVLIDNMAKWGTSNHLVTNNSTIDFKKLNNFFDVILVDAPCSGSGMFRKSKESINQWSLRLVEQCSIRQKIILGDILPSLKVKGILIYSTCSFSAEENESISDYLVNKFDIESVAIKHEKKWGIVETESEIHNAKGYRFYPYRTEGEGFFFSVFKKHSDSKIITNSSANKLKTDKSELPEEYRIKSPINKTILRNSPNQLSVLSSEVLPGYLELKAIGLNIVKTGITAGELKGKDFIPHHDFALGNLEFAKDFKANLNYSEAIQYLSGGQIQNKFQLGWKLAVFNNFNLGWFKQLEDRINNYYPKPLRIKKSIDSLLRI